MLRVAIVGAGPAAFFAAAELLKGPGACVDLFDRSPAPYGLVRHGVAPDHPAIKSVIGRYDASALAAGSRFRLLGNVEVGRDLPLAELARRYHAVVLAYGASRSRRLGIPGEELPGVVPASDFVGWYNGHPDQAAAQVDLACERAVIVGVGNVALDVARILLRPLEALAATDISDRALAALRHRRIREVVLLGRQGCAQAAFTAPELAELARMEGFDLVIAPEDRQLDPQTAARRAAGELDPPTLRKLAAVDLARERAGEGRKVARIAFFSSPVEILGGRRVEGVRIARNALLPSPEGGLRLAPTGHSEVLACGLVLPSAGYRVEPLAGVPFDEMRGLVPNLRGQVLDQGAPVPGLFVTGWARRGPRGVIGSNKPDAQETVRTLLEAFRSGALPQPAVTEDVEVALAARGIRFVSYPDWRLLDSLEVEAGRPQGRPRRKFTDAASMLEALARPEPELDGTGG